MIQAPNRSKVRTLAGALLGVGCAALVCLAADEPKAETPASPDAVKHWKVHDMSRAKPQVITPGTASTPEQAGKAPSDATVLFDGKDLAAWSGGGGKDAPWKVENGYMEGAKESINTREAFGDVQLHLEWSEPTPGKGSSQGRGNSGVLLMGRYEIQVLDSFENETYADGQCGSVYGQHPPLVNASRPPGEWQTYDIVFHAPKFDGKTLAQPGTVTVLHNGVLVQDHWVIKGTTSHAKVAEYSPHPAKLPLQLQFHGNAVRYRNVWARPLPEQPAEVTDLKTDEK